MRERYTYKNKKEKKCEDNAVGQNLFASSGRYVSLCKLYNSTRLARKKGITLAPLVSSTSSTLWEITFLRGLREVSREKYSRRISSDRHFLTTSSVLERKKDENRLWIDVNGGTYELFFFFKRWKLALFNWEGNFQKRETEEIVCINKELLPLLKLRTKLWRARR